MIGPLGQLRIEEAINKEAALLEPRLDDAEPEEPVRTSSIPEGMSLPQNIINSHMHI